MTIIEHLRKAEEHLTGSGVETPRLDAEVLLSHVLGVERIDLYSKREIPLGASHLEQFDSFIGRRATREPVAYITGVKEFWSMPVKLTKNVLIPRPETEHVIERVLEIVKNHSRSLDILDLCTGSGNIAMALASELANARFTVTDISSEALNVARENLDFAKDRVEFLSGSLFESITTNERRATSTERRSFDIITANPPYARPCDFHLFSREIEFEPEMAIFGGPEGLDLISEILKDACNYLKPGGWLVMETGVEQSDKVRSIANETGEYSDILVTKDLAGIDRVMSMRKSK